MEDTGGLAPGGVGYASGQNKYAKTHPQWRFAPGAPDMSDAPGAPGAKSTSCGCTTSLKCRIQGVW